MLCTTNYLKSVDFFAELLKKNKKGGRDVFWRHMIVMVCI